MAAKDDDEREGREGREIKGGDQTGRSIPPATAYAFIIIHEIPRRRVRGLPSAPRTGSKRLIENDGREERGEREGEGEEEDSLPMRGENISSKQKQGEPPSYERRRRAKPAKGTKRKSRGAEKGDDTGKKGTGERRKEARVVEVASSSFLLLPPSR